MAIFDMEAIFKDTFNLPNSFLKYRNIGSKYAESVEIGMPYMIMYESISPTLNRAVYFEFTESNNNYIFNTHDFLRSQGERPLHYHNFYELTIVLSGELTLQIENESINYKPGDCCICNKNIRHKEIIDSEYEIVLFMLTEDYLRDLLNGDLKFDSKGMPIKRDTLFYKLFRDNEKNHFFDAKEYIDFRINKDFDGNDFFKLLNSMIMTIRDSSAGKSYLMRAYFCEFFEMLENKSLFDVKVNWAKLTNEDNILYNVGEYLEKNAGKISVPQLEAKLGYNGDYINRVIKKRTGKTLSEFARDYLLELAANKLDETNDSIGDICLSLGYSNRSFFNKIFIKKYGLSPSEYRKRC